MSDATRPAPKAEKSKAPETLKVAYTKTADDKGFADIVVFGTTDSRNDFLVRNTNTWWRLADVVKGQTLLDALSQGKS